MKTYIIYYATSKGVFKELHTEIDLKRRWWRDGKTLSEGVLDMMNFFNSSLRPNEDERYLYKIEQLEQTVLHVEEKTDPIIEALLELCILNDSDFRIQPINSVL